MGSFQVQQPSSLMTLPWDTGAWNKPEWKVVRISPGDSDLEAVCWSLGYPYLFPPSLTYKAFILSLIHENTLSSFMLFSGTPGVSSSGPVQCMAFILHEAVGTTNSPTSP